MALGVVEIGYERDTRQNCLILLVCLPFGVLSQYDMSHSTRVSSLWLSLITNVAWALVTLQFDTSQKHLYRIMGYLMF